MSEESNFAVHIAECKMYRQMVDDKIKGLMDSQSALAREVRETFRKIFTSTLASMGAIVLLLLGAIGGLVMFGMGLSK